MGEYGKGLKGLHTIVLQALHKWILCECKYTVGNVVKLSTCYIASENTIWWFHGLQFQSGRDSSYWALVVETLVFLAEQVSWAPCFDKGRRGPSAECTSLQEETGVRSRDLPAVKNLLLETFPCVCRWITIQLDFHALDEPDKDFPWLGRIRWI